MESRPQPRAERRRLSHMDRAGRPRMVDVSDKPVTARRAGFVTIGLDTDERPAALTLGNGLAEDASIDRSQQVAPTRESPDGRTDEELEGDRG